VNTTSVEATPAVQRIIVEVRGGSVTDILSNNPNVIVIVRDFDSESVGELLPPSGAIDFPVTLADDDELDRRAGIRLPTRTEQLTDLITEMREARDAEPAAAHIRVLEGVLLSAQGRPEEVCCDALSEEQAATLGNWFDRMKRLGAGASIEIGRAVIPAKVIPLRSS
jgi:hypothetical protein